jgi:hypothetical protein
MEKISKELHAALENQGLFDDDKPMEELFQDYMAVKLGKKDKILFGNVSHFRPPEWDDNKYTMSILNQMQKILDDYWEENKDEYIEYCKEQGYIYEKKPIAHLETHFDGVTRVEIWR